MDIRIYPGVRPPTCFTDGSDRPHSPLIGGTLANPATRYPDSLGKIALFRQFPYFLPCATAGALALTAFIFAFFGLKEVRKLPPGLKSLRLPTHFSRHSRPQLHVKRKLDLGRRQSLYYRRLSPSNFHSRTP